MSAGLISRTTIGVGHISDTEEELSRYSITPLGEYVYNFTIAYIEEGAKNEASTSMTTRTKVTGVNGAATDEEVDEMLNEVFGNN